METLPDLLSLSDDELSALLAQLEDGEDAISRRRRVLHGRIDILRAERTERLKAQVAAGSFEAHAATLARAAALRGHGRRCPPRPTSSRCPTSPSSTTTRSGPRSGALEQEEDDISLNRRVMHAQIDIIRAERAKRARGGGEHVDAGRSRLDPRRRAMSHIYCPECGFQSPEAATYCSRCGALLVRETVGETTMSLGPDEVEPAPPAESIDGPALVVRSGGGRAGESFEAIGDRALIGRSPECDVFLDDVTVSRRHAELVRDGERVHDPRPRQPQRHVRQPAPDREQPCSRTTTRSRSASTG